MADENIVTNIVAKADFSNLIADLNKVSFSLTKLQDQLVASNKMLAAQVGVMNRSFADTLRSTGQFSTHFVSLTSDVDKFGSQLDKGQLKLGKFFQVYRQHAATSGGLIRDLAKQQVQLQNAIMQPLGKNAQGLMQYNVHIPRGLDLIKNKSAIARQELQIMNKVVQEGANQLINWGKNTQWAGRQLTVGLTVPLAAFGKASADAFKQADEQLVRLTKVYGGVAATSAKELGKVRADVSKTAEDLAKSYGASFKDTIALAADIAATGKTGNELLGSIRETTRLAVLGEVDRQDAMKATLAIQTAFKQNTEQLSESINFLNAVENQTSTTLNDLVEAIPKAGPIIKGLGGDVKDLALYLTAMREGGINASEGANALKSGLASLINPTKVAKEMFAGFGISLTDIVNKNAGNTTATILELQAALETLNPLQKQQALEQLFGKFQFARMNALFENLGKQGSQTLQVLDLMKASSQDLANVAGRELGMVTESASGKYRRAVEGLKADLAGIGEQFLKINTSLINFVDGIIKFVQKLPDPIKQALGFMGMLTAAAGPLIMLTGVLGNFFGYIIKGAYHFKSLFKGGEGWKLLTPEILAAQKAGNLVEQTFYSDAKAAAVLKQAIAGLTAEFTILQQKAASAAMTVNPAISTVAGGVIIPGQRVVNPNNPLAGAMGTRAAGHHIPRSQMSEAERLAQTIHSFTPVPIPLNQKIGAVPQVFTEGDLPRIPGLTVSGGASTGIVAGEAAKWHALMGTLSMLTKREVADLKKEIARTGTFSTEINTTFGQLLPAMTNLTSNAAAQSAAIVAELQAGKITVDAARTKIIAINAQLETMMAQTTTQVAADLGRTANLTQVPLINQPIVGPTGKANIKELFRAKRPSAGIIDKIARALGVRTFGAGYSTETTMPKRMNQGDIVPGTGNTDTVPAMLTPGEFVVNKEATAANLPLLMDINNNRQSSGNQMAIGGMAGGFRALSSLVGGARRIARPGIRPSNRVAVESGALDYNQMQGRAGRSSIWNDPVLGLGRPNSDEVVGHLFTNDFYSRIGQRAGRASSPQLTSQDLFSKTGIRLSSRSGYSGSYDILPNNYMVISKDFNRSLNLGSATAEQWLNSNRGPQHLTSLLSYLMSKGIPANTALNISRAALNQINLKVSKIRGPISESMFGNIVTNTSASVIKNSPLLSQFNASVRGIHPNTYSIHSKGRSTSLGMPLNRIGSTWSNPRYIGGSTFHTYTRANRGGYIGMNSGGMVPGSKRPKGYAMGGTVGQLVGGTAGWMGGSMLGQRVGGDAGSMIGGMAGSMALPALIASKGLFNPWIAGATLIVGTTVALKKYYDKLQETSRLNRLAFSGAVKPVKDFDSEIEKVRKNITATRQAYDLFLAQNTQIGVSGVKLTVTEFQNLQKEVKKTYPDIVKLLNQTSYNNLSETVANLKSQFITAGESAEKATQKVYALLTVSNKSKSAAGIISDQQVRNVTDLNSAINQMLKTLSTAQNVGGSKGFVSSLTGTFTGLDSSYDSLVKSEGAAKSLQKQFDAISNSQSRNLKLTQDQIKELAQQDPVLASMLKTTNSIGDAYAIWRINLAGISRDLDGLSSNQLQNLAKYAAAIQDYFTKISDVSSAEAQGGAFGDLAKNINSFNRAQKTAQLNAQSVQKSTEDQIKLKQKEIDLIKKEAAERKKALQEQVSTEDTKLQIQKEQLSYQNAIASGDMSAAAQAQINIQRLVGASQLKAAESAIDDAAQSKIDKIQATIDSLGKTAEIASTKASAGTKESPFKTIYDQLISLQQKIVSSGGQITSQDEQTYALLVKQLQSTKGGAELASSMNLVPGSEIKDRPFSTSVLGYQGSNLKDIAGSAQAVIAKNTGDTVAELKNIYMVLSGKETGTGLGTKAAPVIAGNVPSNQKNIKYTESSGELSDEGKKYIVSQYKLQEGDYFEYKGQRYVTKISYDKVKYNKTGIAVKAAMGGYIRNYDMGSIGGVRGPGTSTSDSIPAMLSNGEYVLRASAVNAIGVPLLDEINKMAMGGLATRYDVSKKSIMPTNMMGYNRGGTVQHYNVGGLTMNFADGGEVDGRMLYEQFKGAMALDNLKSGNGGRLI